MCTAVTLSAVVSACVYPLPSHIWQVNFYQPLLKCFGILWQTARYGFPLAFDHDVARVSPRIVVHHDLAGRSLPGRLPRVCVGRWPPRRSTPCRLWIHDHLATSTHHCDSWLPPIRWSLQRRATTDIARHCKLGVTRISFSRLFRVCIMYSSSTAICSALRAGPDPAAPIWCSPGGPASSNGAVFVTVSSMWSVACMIRYDPLCSFGVHALDRCIVSELARRTLILSLDIWVIALKGIVR